MSKNEYISTINQEQEWHKGFLGFFFRYRGVIVSGVANAAGAAFSLVKQNVELAIAIAIIGALFVWVLLLIRQMKLTRIRLDYLHHELMHQLRDSVHYISESTSTEVRRVRVHHFLDNLVEVLASYFRVHMSDQTVNCFLKLSEMDPETGVQVYATKARSRGLDREREWNSVSVKASAGIPNSLLNKKGQGAYIIRDVAEAIRDGVWVPSSNDFAFDAQTYLVCPINGWTVDADGKDRIGMLGILHITSCHDHFERGDWLAMKGFADVLGLVLPIVFSAADSNPQTN